MKKAFPILIFFLALFIDTSATNYLANDITHVNQFISKAKPGDTITLANGAWKNINLLFKANGNQNHPIVLAAQTPGQVKIEGASTLVLDGNYLVVNGLLFTNGHGNGKYVISYAASSNNPSTHCRITNCAIIDFNLPKRFPGDNWVAVYGSNNRFDHNYLAGKKNAGTTLVVKLNSPKSQNNHNRIDHNYFGKRERLGSNGGETMRIGTSTYSLKTSATLVEQNYFEHCNGEVEIISVKSCDNVIRDNAFFECEGTLTLRHGNNNQIYNNLFIGNGKPFTGGVRVINMGHTIHDNYFYRLTGNRFRSAFAVMNGVPHSAKNRYLQVKNVKIFHNAFIGCNHIGFGVGSDNERTAVPIATTFTQNVIYAPVQKDPVNFIDTVNGITFSKNLLYAPRSDFRYKGFIRKPMSLSKGKDQLYHIVTGKVSKVKLPGGISRDVLPQWREAGPEWIKSFLKTVSAVPAAHTIRVNNNEGELSKAVKNAIPGDTILLVSDGEYPLQNPLVIDKLLFIKAAKTLKKRPILVFNNRKKELAQIIIANNGNLWVQGIAFNGENSQGYKASSAISTAKGGMINHYWLKVADCEFYNYTESTFSAFKALNGSYADSIVFCNSLFHTISGDAISLASQKEDRGIYNAEYVTINNCVFYHVMGAALNFYRGGNDESTLGPFLHVNHCVFYDVNNKELGAVLRLIGVQYSDITHSVFYDSGKSGRSIWFINFEFNHNAVSNCDFYNSGKIGSFYDNVMQNNIYHIKPLFENIKAYNFNLVNKKEIDENMGISRLRNKSCHEIFPPSVL
jgi:poly(beta-D-mannuronate) lyase